ncbi:MAG: PH domain-containing protein [Planctomycetota bacterium]|nr:PH domain-containing protein [Planctomycetota bacterium]
MTETLTRPGRPPVAAQSDGGGAVLAPMEEVVPAHLLDGDEVVHFAIKPSLWFIPIDSIRWLAAGLLLALAGNLSWLADQAWYLYQAALWMSLIRLGWATLQWVSRLYVLTNRRVLRLRGVLNVELFECPLHKIQNTRLSLSLAERLTRVGTITLQTAGGSATAGGTAGGTASWRLISRPLEVHEKLRSAINRAQNRGNDGL